MAELDSALRNALESQIVKARDVSEAAADAALRGLAVHQRDALPHHNEDQRALRRALRAKARQLGDPLERHPNDPMPALTRELAYERWHQMLFAAFLAHNYLLIHPTENVPVTLQDCEELATHEGDPDGWHTAARYASHMLPGIFKPTDPLLQVQYAPEHHQTLEQILNDIPPPTYTSDDGLGWVYQFWQTKQKKTVNESGRKIGGADIAPVTQLFTEHYMVQFLLHNTLGAWWTARHSEIPLPTSKSYLRTLDDGTPAAGTFDGWPATAKDITVMDPCCGSGHFLIAAFTLLQRFRMIEEGLTEAEAGDAVLRDNLHGLELDPRCTQLAAFNLALHAWKRGGYRPLPPLNIACSGIPAGGTEHDWTNLTDDPRAKNALKQLHHLFKNAPDLGSLIDPNRLAEHDPLYTANFAEIASLLDKALVITDRNDPPSNIFGEAARGLAHAARLLAGPYTLVATNVPYLGRGKQVDALARHLERTHTTGRADLATAFMLRSRDWLEDGGVAALVSPQNWWHQTSYTGFRGELLETTSLRLLASLGEESWSTFGLRGPKASLVVFSVLPAEGNVSTISGIDTSRATSMREIDQELLRRSIHTTSTQEILSNPDSAIALDATSRHPRLSDFATTAKGLSSSDNGQFIHHFWERDELGEGWEWLQSSPKSGDMFSGMDQTIRFENGNGRMRVLNAAQGQDRKRDLMGSALWGKRGVLVSLMRELRPALYLGHIYDTAGAALVPNDAALLPAVLCFVSDPAFTSAVRKVNSSVLVESGYLVKVPFDVKHWASVATQAFPYGLPKPYSDDPTQWLFHGHPAPATEPLQVAVARLLGYEWPAETDLDMEVSDEARAWIAKSRDLISFADADGIVCLPPIAGEKPAAERLRNLLAHAYGNRWTTTTEAALLATVGYDGKTLHDWLWGDYFKQHSKLFNNRPFIWHITDGLKDGFSALVNYHKLNRALLERLIYTYLGNWIQQQQDAANTNTRGADKRLAAAQDLKTKLELILQGEPPYDIFIRWKPLHEQPIGWEPDLNDGVRLNIRPFVTAGVLRSKFTINWNKDRGNDPTPNATGTTERHNDRHLTHQQKHDARKAHQS